MNQIKIFGLIIILLCLALIVCASSHAEPYVQVSAGMVGPSNWSGWRSEYATAGQATEQDLYLNSGWAAGAKAGYWGESLPWLGIELDYTGARHDLRGANHRHITYTADPRGGAEYGIDAAKYIVHAVGINVVVRYPGEIWQPYAGIGPALFGGTQGGSPMNIQGGWNVEAGVRANLSQHIYATVEAKYQQVRTFHTEPTGPYGHENGQSALLSRPIVLVGIGYAF